MCAYFFAVQHSPNDFQLDQAGLKLKNLITSDVFKLVPEMRESSPFDRNSQIHANIITDLTNAARKKLLDVKAIDKEISVAFTLGVVASFSSFIPFNWLIAPAALIYTGYLAKERDTAYAEYTQALKSLHNCCDWAVNNGELTKREDMDHPQVLSMLGLLSQVMTKTQMAGIIADEFENDYFNTIGFNDESDAVKKETLDYKIYGFDQGGSISEILAKLAGSLKQMLTKAATEAMVYLNTPAAPGLN